MSETETKQQIRTALGAVSGHDALPPHSVEAEEALISALMMFTDEIAEVATLVDPEDCFIVRNEWILAAIYAVWHSDQPVTYGTVVEELRTQGHLPELNNGDDLARVMRASFFEFGDGSLPCALIVQRLADRRRLSECHRRGIETIYDESVPLQQAYADAMQALIDVKPRVLDQALTVGASISDRFLELQSKGSEATRVFALPFGGDEGLPFMTGGKLFGIGGDEKTGKSALAETLSEHWAQLGHKGFYIHTEEKPDAKIYRRFSRWSGIPFLKLEAGQLSAADIAKRGHALEVVAPWESRLDLWYESLPTPARVLSLIRRAIQVFKVDFLVLDNFTDVDFTGGDRNSTQAQEAMKLLQQIDDLAAHHNVLIVLVTQMSTQQSGKRIAHGTSGFNKKMTWFWDINRKVLKEPLEYTADGATHRLEPGAFDPRVDIFIPASRYGSGAKISAFADLRRFLWRERIEVKIAACAPPKPDAAIEPHWNDTEPATLDLAGF